MGADSSFYLLKRIILFSLLLFWFPSNSPSLTYIHASKDNNIPFTISKEDNTKTNNLEPHNQVQEDPLAQPPSSIRDRANAALVLELKNASATFSEWTSIYNEYLRLPSSFKHGPDREGVAMALWKLANRYTWGWKVKQNNVKAKDFWEKSSKLGHQGSTSILFWMNKAPDIATNPDSAVDYTSLKWAAQQLISYNKDSNDPDALFYIGWFYFKGLGVERDEIKAAEYFRKCADRVHASCINRLAHSYMHGLGNTQNEVLALELFEKSASLGHMHSHGIVARSLLMKNGFSSKDAIIYHYKEAARLGDPKAYKELQDFLTKLKNQFPNDSTANVIHTTKSSGSRQNKQEL